MATDVEAAGTLICGRCNKRRAVFVMAGAPKCMPCVLRYPPLLRRSLLTAAVVGTILTAINHGNVIVAGSVPDSLFWKVPLTYCVPFLVTTWGALINSRVRRA